MRKLRYSHAGGGTLTSQGPATQARRSYSDFCGSRDCRRRGTKRAGQRASVLSPQARTIAIALPRQTIALAARGAPIKLRYKQKIPSEPRTGAIPNHATPDRRSAKFMLSVIRKCCQSASEHVTPRRARSLETPAGDLQRRDRGSADSSLEGNGFELPVPRAVQGAEGDHRRLRLHAAVGRLFAAALGGHHPRRAKRNLGTEALSRAEPEVRIHLPPAGSHQRTGPRLWTARGVADAVELTAGGSRIRIFGPAVNGAAEGAPGA